jgi:hypothetical protein
MVRTEVTNTNKVKIIMNNNKIMDNRKQFADEFSELLNQCLIKKYKKTPSASFVANQFNFRANGTTTITAETARKWMRGIAVPEIDRFIVLMLWLEFQPGQMFGIGDKLNERSEVSELIEILEKQLNVIKTTIDEYKK